VLVPRVVRVVGAKGDAEGGEVADHVRVGGVEVLYEGVGEVVVFAEEGVGVVAVADEVGGV